MTTVLGIECAGAFLSVAIVKNKPEGIKNTNDKEGATGANGKGISTLAFIKPTATFGFPEILVPTIEQALKEAQLSYKDIDIVAASKGAGSFTGVRIALATASGLVLASAGKMQGIGVTDFAASAFMVDEGERAASALILTVLATGRQGDFYIAGFDKDLQEVIAPIAATALDFAPTLTEFVKDKSATDILLAGVAAPAFMAELAPLLPSLAPRLKVAKNTTPDAQAIASFALCHKEKAKPADKSESKDFALAPLYVSPAHVTVK